MRIALEDDRPAWDAFVASRPEGDPLQTWAWGEVAATTGEPPQRILVERRERIVGVAQALVRPAGFGRQVIYVPHGPVWDRDAADAPSVLTELIDGLRSVAREVRGLVVKVDPRASVGGSGEILAGALSANRLRRARHDLQAPSTRIVELLDGGEALMKTWHADARRLSKRSEREGVTTDVDQRAALDAVSSFHDLLEATAERGRFRLRSLDFLQQLASSFAAADGWYVVLARFEGRPIAGMAIPRVADRAYYLYGASLRDPDLKHKYGAYAAMAAAMRALAQDGVRTLDMWGVLEPEDTQADPAWEGFSAFKRTFGGSPLRHPGTFDLVTDPAWYAARELRERLRHRLRS